jgi:septal ring factor EnvC (AmiA/AmiB activator)
MKSCILTIVALCLLAAPGCGNLSPRQRQDLDDNQGQIGAVESMANSNKLELGKLQSQAEIQNSKLDKIQQGLANIQSVNENSGVQILSGPGGLIISLVGILAACVLVVHYRGQAKQQEKVANMLAERIVSCNDPQLNDEVFRAAMHTNVEENVLHLIKKHQEGS